MAQQTIATVYPAQIRKLTAPHNQKCLFCTGVGSLAAHEGEFSSTCCDKKPCKDNARNSVGRQVQKRRDDEAEAQWKRDQRKQKKLGERAQNGKKKKFDLMEIVLGA
jgi:hypothetical protein